MKNTSILHYIIGTVAGIVIGSLIWNTPEHKNSSHDMHMMPDGTVMENGAMDMRSMMADMNAALAGKTGDAFDQTFISEMIVHHEGAVDMAKLALLNAKHPEIKTLATAIISTQTAEIKQMNEWFKAWYSVKE